VPGLAARFFVRITCPLIVVRRYPDECMAIPVIIDLYNIYMYVMYIYIYTHTHTRIYICPVWDRRPQNRSAIPTTGYGPASAQIQAYSDWTTWFSRTGSNRACSAAIYRKTPVQSGANLTLYIRTISGQVNLTCILYIVYFLYFFTICAWIGPTLFVRITRPLVVVRRYPQTLVYIRRAGG